MSLVFIFQKSGLKPSTLVGGGSVKKELVHQWRFKTRAEAKAAIFEYIEVFYNRQRRHSGIRYQTPQQAFENMTWKIAA